MASLIFGKIKDPILTVGVRDLKAWAMRWFLIPRRNLTPPPTKKNLNDVTKGFRQSTPPHFSSDSCTVNWCIFFDCSLPVVIRVVPFVKELPEREDRSQWIRSSLKHQHQSFVWVSIQNHSNWVRRIIRKFQAKYKFIVKASVTQYTCSLNDVWLTAMKTDSYLCVNRLSSVIVCWYSIKTEQPFLKDRKSYAYINASVQNA